MSALSGAEVEQLGIYGKDLYLEPDCVNGATPLPVHCNYMGLGQECRGCFLTCDGATQYMDDFSEEITVWVRPSFEKELCLHHRLVIGIDRRNSTSSLEPHRTDRPVFVLRDSYLRM